MTETPDMQVPVPKQMSGEPVSSTTPPGTQDSTSPPQEPSAPTTPTPASAPAPEWRAPDTAPDWARGKSPEEILGISQQMFSTLERFNQTGSYGNAPQTPATPPQAAPQPVAQPPQAPTSLSGDDYVTGDQVQAYAADQLSRYNQQQQADTANLSSQLASLAKTQVRNANQDVFAKYGPEIETYVAQLGPGAQTVDNLQHIVKLVQGNHLDELVEARARELTSVNAEPTMRPGGGPTVPGDINPPNDTLDDERVPEQWKERARRVGITDAKVDEWCQSQGITKKQFYSDFEREPLSAPEVQ